LQLLLDAGADPFAKNNEGETPLEHLNRRYKDKTLDPGPGFTKLLDTHFKHPQQEATP